MAFKPIFVHPVCLPKSLVRHKLSLLLFSFIFFSSCEQSTSPLPAHAPELRGLSYTSFGVSDFMRGSAVQALADAKNQTAADCIALNVFVYQDSERTTTIYPTLQTSSDEDIRQAASDARALGMKLFLKINVDVIHGRWRGYITPDDAGLWFASYTATMLHYCTLAEQLNIELFSVGCELIAATQPRYATQWRTLISRIRSQYNGQLVYCANWNGISDLGLSMAEYRQVPFWDALDNIGVDVYQPLATSPQEIPSLNTATSRLSGMVDELYQLSVAYQRPVIVTETGLASVRGALAAPYDFSLVTQPTAQHDEYSQRLFYSAIMSVFGSRSWCRGIFWWNWESVESPNASNNYTPRNKQAAILLKSWYNIRS